MRIQTCITAGLIVIIGLQAQAKADLIVRHGGATDPTTENFGRWPFNGSIATTPLANDLGFAAWQITNSGATNEQAFYNQLGGTGPFDPGGSGLTQQQSNTINANGFVMSLRARIVQGPIYDPNGTGLFSIDSTLAGFNGSRYDIALGSDGQGNTLVILSSSTSFNDGVTFSSTPFGSPLLVAGTDYHLYQLSYNPTTLQAALFVDGVQRLTGYTGSSVSGGATANNYGLSFGTANDATGNFALAELDSGQITFLIGDYDGNGVVDAADYVVWRNGLGTIYTQNDYDVWRAHFGQMAGSGSGVSANAAVPEPATLVLLTLATTCWCLRRGRAA